MPAKVLVFDIADSTSNAPTTQQNNLAENKQLIGYMVKEIISHHRCQVRIRVTSNTTLSNFSENITNELSEKDIEALITKLINNHYQFLDSNSNISSKRLLTKSADTSDSKLQAQTPFTFPNDETHVTYIYSLAHGVAAEVFQQDGDNKMYYYRIDARKERLTDICDFFRKYHKLIPLKTTFNCVSIANTAPNKEEEFEGDGKSIDRQIHDSLIYLCEMVFKISVENVKNGTKITSGHHLSKMGPNYASFLGQINRPALPVRPLSPGTVLSMRVHEELLDSPSECDHEDPRRQHEELLTSQPATVCRLL